MTRRGLCRRNDGFTLIELLVCVAILAILAAILFPVFASAREKGRQVACVSNLKQIGHAFAMYAQDYDETICPAVDLVTPARNPPLHWHDLLQPYFRTEALLHCPSDEYRAQRLTSYGWNYPHMPYRYPRPGENPARVPGNPGAFALAYWSSVADVFIVGDSDAVWPGKFIYYQFLYCPTGTRLFDEIPRGDTVLGDEHEWTGFNVRGATPHGNVSARHTGGSNLVYLDGHAQFRSRTRIMAPTRAAQRLWGHTRD